MLFHNKIGLASLYSACRFGKDRNLLLIIYWVERVVGLVVFHEV